MSAGPKSVEQLIERARRLGAVVGAGAAAGCVLLVNHWNLDSSLKSVLLVGGAAVGAGVQFEVAKWLEQRFRDREVKRLEAGIESLERILSKTPPGKYRDALNDRIERAPVALADREYSPLRPLVDLPTPAGTSPTFGSARTRSLPELGASHEDLMRAPPPTPSRPSPMRAQADTLEEFPRPPSSGKLPK